MVISWHNQYPVYVITNIQIYVYRNCINAILRYHYIPVYYPPLDIIIVFTLYPQLVLMFYTDLDECEINGTCPEHSTCANTFGSFVCTCNEGFMKNGSVCLGKNLLLISEILTFPPLHPPDAHLFINTLLQMWMNVKFIWCIAVA